MIGISSYHALIARSPLNTPMFTKLRIKDEVMMGEAEVANMVILLIFLIDAEDNGEAILKIGINHTICTKSIGISSQKQGHTPLSNGET